MQYSSHLGYLQFQNSLCEAEMFVRLDLVSVFGPTSWSLFLDVADLRCSSGERGCFQI